MNALEFRLSAKDLVGCRYRAVLDYLGKDSDMATPTGSRRKQHRVEHAQRVLANLAVSQPIVKVLADDADLQFLATLEAMASGAHLISGALLLGDGQISQPDLLVRTDGGTGAGAGITYAPVFIVAHKVFEKRERTFATAALAVDTQRLGQSPPVSHQKIRFRPRHFDTIAAAQAHQLLSEYGCAADVVGLIGFDDSKTIFESAEAIHDVYATALRQTRRALAAADGKLAPVPIGTFPLAPRKVRECRSCRHWSRCQTELAEADDISLLVPGDRGDEFRSRGITTLTALANDAKAGEVAALARAWKLGVPALRKRDSVSAPRADVEIDIDMEAYLEHGCYLWGTFDGEQYRPFVTWGELGRRAEAENFAEFWQWLQTRRNNAAAENQSCLIYCYAAQGENHWLRSSAQRFAAWRADIVGIPTAEEVDEFISSGQWVDMFRVVKKQLAGPHGLSLKTVAPLAGFQWRDTEADGEASLDWYREATALAGASGVSQTQAGDITAKSMAAARRRLLEYNEDDCRATAILREWLDGAGAQLLPTVPQLLPRASDAHLLP